MPEGGSFDEILALKGDKEIGDKINKIIGRLARANSLEKVIDLANFNDEEKLGTGREMVDRLSKLVAIFSDLDFRGSRAEGDDLLGDAYEYLMRHFATESGKSKGQFYTPAEVSRVLAKIVGIGPETKQDQTVYDPACGSGSLLLKAAAEAPRGITIYGQEKDNATWALCEMNMILHNHAVAVRDIMKGDSITSPKFTDGGRLRTFDFIVMNPPFSLKSWSNGLEEDYGRFDFGWPPEKNGDYAFLLHVLASLKSTGKAAIIMPHGVLFRSNAEATIRRELLRRGYIKGIVGLPPNLFYGTGIPACIVVLDKENAHARKGVFMIDASRGFIKDGPKNRLRSQDIHKIVDTFNRQVEIHRYSRMVPLYEIASETNDCNLNIPRYIDSTEPEDLQDLNAHIHGGIPEHDIEALKPYWDAFPELRTALFKPNRPGYADLAVDPQRVQQAILDSAKFQAFTARVRSMAADWFEAHRMALETIKPDTRPNDLITNLGDDLLSRFKPVALLDEYDVYEQLMMYWHGIMHDDVFLIMQEGWAEAATPRKPIVNKDRKLAEAPDLVIGSRRGATMYKMDLIPPGLIIARYFPDEQAKVDELNLIVEEASRAVQEYIEEHATEQGRLEEAIGDNGKVTKTSVTARLKKARYEKTEKDEIEALQHIIDLFNAELIARANAREAQENLDLATLKQYAKLTEDDVKTLVLDDKWQATVLSGVIEVVQGLAQVLVNRTQVLGERYGKTVTDLIADTTRLDELLVSHLSEMGVK